jgi:hypothetical protein
MANCLLVTQNTKYSPLPLRQFFSVENVNPNLSILRSLQSNDRPWLLPPPSGLNSTSPTLILRTLCVSVERLKPFRNSSHDRLDISLRTLDLRTEFGAKDISFGSLISGLLSRRAEMQILVLLDGPMTFNQIKHTRHLYKLIAVGCGGRPRSRQDFEDILDSHRRGDHRANVKRLRREKREQRARIRRMRLQRTESEGAGEGEGEGEGEESEDDWSGNEAREYEVSGKGNTMKLERAIEEVTDFVVMLVKQVGDHYERRGMAIVDAKAWLSRELKTEMQWIVLR